MDSNGHTHTPCTAATTPTRARKHTLTVEGKHHWWRRPALERRRRELRLRVRHAANAGPRPTAHRGGSSRGGDARCWPRLRTEGTAPTPGRGTRDLGIVVQESEESRAPVSAARGGQRMATEGERSEDGSDGGAGRAKTVGDRGGAAEHGSERRERRRRTPLRLRCSARRSGRASAHTHGTATADGGHPRGTRASAHYFRQGRHLASAAAMGFAASRSRCAFMLDVCLRASFPRVQASILEAAPSRSRAGGFLASPAGRGVSSGFLLLPKKPMTVLHGVGRARW